MDARILVMDQNGKVTEVFSIDEIPDYFEAKCIIVEKDKHRILVIGWDFFNNDYYHKDIAEKLSRHFDVAESEMHAMIRGGGRVDHYGKKFLVNAESGDFKEMNKETVQVIAKKFGFEVGPPYD